MQVVLLFVICASLDIAAGVKGAGTAIAAIA